MNKNSEILKLYTDKGFLLDRERLDFFSELGIENTQIIIKEFIDLDIKERLITKNVFEKYSKKFKNIKPNKEYSENKNSVVKILSSPNFLSGKIEINDFVKYFRSRYESIKKILEMRDFDNLSSIRRIGSMNGVWTIIAMVSSKRITKNKNLLIEVEDLTGTSIVLVNKENSKLFKEARNLMLDDIVAFKVSGSIKILFANNIIYPDSNLKEEKYSNFDEYVAFSGDFHVGSKMFLEKNVLKFINWLNGNIGDERQKEIALKVRYLFLLGDNIEGVGQYPGQENFLEIKSCREQYKKFKELLEKIRKDIQIIVCPGQHDAVWIGEPQPIPSGKWMSGLSEIENLSLVPNPSLVEIDGGFKILMYHGTSINQFIDNNFEIRTNYGHKHPTKVIKEILKRRHLSPTHGLVDYVPCKDKDSLVIDVVPDIIATANQHRAEIDCYNNILMISSSCWQSITPFEEKIGNVPEPCRVPLFNLKTREIKIIDFSGGENNEIKWDESENLTCKLENKNG